MPRPLSALALIPLVAVAIGPPAATPPARAAEPPKPVPSIKELMREAHACRTAYIGDVRKELGKGEPDWAVIGGKAGALVRVGKLVALNTPPKGDRESWERLTGLYVARAEMLVNAAKRQDTEEVLTIIKRMNGACVTCHRAHR